MKTVCFDFDGVLAAYDGWKGGSIGDPIPGGVALLKLCNEAGYRVVVQSCRTHVEHGEFNSVVQLAMMKSWLVKHDIPHDHIEVDGKAMAKVYVDDRGMHFHQQAGKKLDGYAQMMFKEIKRRMEFPGQ